MGGELRLNPYRYDLLDRTKFPPGTNVYQCLNSDFWLPAADGWRAEVWEMIRKRSDLSYIMMTKRVDRVGNDLPAWVEDADNIGFVTTMESQEAFDRRWKYTRDLPFKNKLITVGPCLEYVDMKPLLEEICQVFVLGEMGDPETVVKCRYEWVSEMMRDCVKFDVNFDLLMAGTKFVGPDGIERTLMSFHDMMRMADAYGLHHVSSTKRQYRHEPSLVFGEVG